MAWLRMLNFVDRCGAHGIDFMAAQQRSIVALTKDLVKWVTLIQWHECRECTQRKDKAQKEGHDGSTVANHNPVQYYCVPI